MKILILCLYLLTANTSYAATSEMHYYDATAFILNHLELPVVGTSGFFERSKTFKSVSITIIVDIYGWGYINFHNSQGSFRIWRSADPGLFEELLNSLEVKNGHADSVWVGCKYTLGQKVKNWFSPFIANCKFSF